MSKLRLANLGVSFGGHRAVDNISLEFKQQSLTAIIGPNGAGKTTLFNLISGQIKNSSGQISGQIFLDNTNITNLPVYKRAKLGLGRVFQQTNLFPNLTVCNNILITIIAKDSSKYSIFNQIDKNKVILNKIDEVIELVKLTKVANNLVYKLSHGDQRKLEVAMLIAMDCQVLMLDEPTAGMSADSIDDILNIIISIKKNKNKTILLVEHKVNVVKKLADRVVVLNNGGLLIDGQLEQVLNSQRVKQIYLGQI